jgi:hypothetical protein
VLVGKNAGVVADHGERQLERGHRRDAPIADAVPMEHGCRHGIENDGAFGDDPGCCGHRRSGQKRQSQSGNHAEDTHPFRHFHRPLLCFQGSA